MDYQGFVKFCYDARLPALNVDMNVIDRVYAQAVQSCVQHQQRYEQNPPPLNPTVHTSFMHIEELMWAVIKLAFMRFKGAQLSMTQSLVYFLDRHVDMNPLADQGFEVDLSSADLKTVQMQCCALLLSLWSRFLQSYEDERQAKLQRKLKGASDVQAMLIKCGLASPTNAAWLAEDDIATPTAAVATATATVGQRKEEVLEPLTPETDVRDYLQELYFRKVLHKSLTTRERLATFFQVLQVPESIDLVLRYLPYFLEVCVRTTSYQFRHAEMRTDAQLFAMRELLLAPCTGVVVNRIAKIDHSLPTTATKHKMQLLSSTKLSVSSAPRSTRKVQPQTPQQRRHHLSKLHMLSPKMPASTTLRQHQAGKSLTSSFSSFGALRTY
jgi:hypothetical protein